MGSTLSERLDRAATWDDLEVACADEGVTLEPKGRGLVVGNATSYTKLSALGLTTSAKDFETRFGASLTTHRVHKPTPPRAWFAVDAVDVAKGLIAWGLTDTSDVRRAINDAALERETTLAAAPIGVRMMRELRKRMNTTSLTPPSHRSPRPKPARRPPSQKPRRSSGGR